MSLKDKASRINLTNLDDPVDPAAAAAPLEVAQTPTHHRSGVASVQQSIFRQQRVKELEAQVANGTIEDLDPASIRPSKWKNRHELSFATQAYRDLVSEIAVAGKNVQPIKVRRIPKRSPEAADEFEIIYGRRRARACQELGLKVRAIVEDLDDQAAFAEMDQENHHRAELTPWEQGVMYKDALDQGVFGNQRALSAKTGVAQSTISKAIRLASLPEEIVAAFPSPLEIQFRWGQSLAEALEKDAVRVTEEALSILKEEPRPASAIVLRRLIAPSAVERPKTTVREFTMGGKVVAFFSRDPRGGLDLKIKPGVISAAAEKKLTGLLDDLLQG